METPGFDPEVTTLVQELSAALDQQTATGTILRAIAASPTEIQPVLNIVAESAARLCKAYDAVILLKDGDFLAVRAHYGPIPVDVVTVPIDRAWVNGRAFVDRRPVQVQDLQVAEEFPGGREFARRQGHRTILAVPLLRRKEAIGTLTVRRREVQPFTHKQIALLGGFADQAVIAIENVRLSEEAQQRNRELTATSEVLGVIARSPTDLQPVFDVIAESAAKLCNSEHAYVHRFDGSLVHFVAVYGLSPDEVASTHRAFPMVPCRGAAGPRAILSGQVEFIPDYEHDPDYELKTEAKANNVRGAVAVPMLHEGMPVGAIVLDRSQSGYFTERQVELLKTFANQAVIALENVRLFEEVKARNHQLAEALEQQTATSGILRAIAASPTDIQPVLDTVAESAAKLCDAFDSVILLSDGSTLSIGAHHGPIPLFTGQWKIGRDLVGGRAILDRKPVNVHDILEAGDEFPVSREWAIGEGQRSLLAVPLLRDERAIGSLVIRRPDVQPFSQQHIDLLATFADQAVIAIANVRLFEEVQARNRQLTETLEQQTATGAILRAIAASPTDIQPVLDAVAESAARLCEAFDSIIFLSEGDALVWKAHHGVIPLDFVSRPIARNWVTGRSYVDRAPVHVHDLTQSSVEFPDSHADAVRQGHRTILAVPLLRDNEAIGALVIRRLEVRPFSEKQIDLLTTFADQALIAIENVRLFEQVQARTRELQQALDYQTATSEVLNVISRSPTQLQPVLDVIIETAVRLCEADGGTIARERDGQYFPFGPGRIFCGVRGVDVAIAG